MTTSAIPVLSSPVRQVQSQHGRGAAGAIDRFAVKRTRESSRYSPKYDDGAAGARRSSSPWTRRRVLLRHAVRRREAGRAVHAQNDTPQFASATFAEQVLAGICSASAQTRYAGRSPPPDLNAGPLLHRLAGGTEGGRSTASAHSSVRDAHLAAVGANQTVHGDSNPSLSRSPRLHRVRSASE